MRFCECVYDKSDNEVRILGFQALKNNLGITGFILFIQQFETGCGNYVNDREEWQRNYTVDTLSEAVKKI